MTDLINLNNFLNNAIGFEDFFHLESLHLEHAGIEIITMEDFLNPEDTFYLDDLFNFQSQDDTENDSKSIQVSLNQLKRGPPLVQ